LVKEDAQIRKESQLTHPEDGC